MASTCSRCSSIHKSCCGFLPSEDLDLRFGLTESDISRAEKALKRDRSTFIDVNFVDWQIDYYKDRLPGIERMYKNGLRRSLKLDSHRRCVLLTSSGCPMDFMTRPRVCALYPFWYTINKQELSLMPFALSDSDRCLSIKEANNDPHKLAKLFGKKVDDFAKLAMLSFAELNK